MIEHPVADAEHAGTAEPLEDGDKIAVDHGIFSYGGDKRRAR